MKTRSMFLVLCLVFGSCLGGSWQALGPDGGLISSLAISPVDSNRIYAGTSYGGVFRSTDGGETWEPCSFGLSGKWAYRISALRISPAQPLTLFAEGSDGVYRTVNGGDSWELFTTAAEAQVVGLDPTNPKRIYGSRSRSTDGGVTWIPYTGVPTDYPPNAIAVDPTNPLTAYFSFGPVYRTTDGGDTWQIVRAQPVDSAQDVVSEMHVTETGLVCLGTMAYVEVSRDRGTTWQLVPGVTGSVQSIVSGRSGNPILVAAGEKLFRSDAAAATWNEVPFLGSGPLALAFDPSSQKIYLGVTDGVSSSTDVGKTWKFSNRGLKAMVIPALHSTGPQGLVYALTPRVLFASADPAKTWEAAAPWVSITPSLAIELGVADDSSLYVLCEPRFLKSVDQGKTWESLSASGRSMAVAANNSIYLLQLSYSSIRKSTDGGKTWRWLSPILPGLTVQPFSLAVSPHDPQVLFCGASWGVFKSTDGGETWRAVSTESPVMQFGFSQSSPGTIYAATDNRVMKSTDSGLTWTKLPLELTVVPAENSFSALMVDRYRPDVVYLGLRGLVFRSFDGGTHWEKFGTGLPNVFITALAVDPARPSRVLAATDGNGVFLSPETTRKRSRRTHHGGR